MKWPWHIRRNADLIAYEGGLVTFASNVEARPKDILEVNAHLPGGEAFGARLSVVHEIESDAFLEQRRAELGYGARRHFYCAQMLQPAMAEDHLTVLLESLPEESGHHHRLSPRVNCCVRVTSPDIRNYYGLTRDLSVTGLSLLADGPLEVDRPVAMQLEFTRAPHELEVAGVVRWSRPADYGERQASHDSGVQFVDLTEAQQNALATYVAALQDETGLWDSSRYHW